MVVEFEVDNVVLFVEVLQLLLAPWIALIKLPLLVKLPMPLLVRLVILDTVLQFELMESKLVVPDLKLVALLVVVAFVEALKMDELEANNELELSHKIMELTAVGPFDELLAAFGSNRCEPMPMELPNRAESIFTKAQN